MSCRPGPVRAGLTPPEPTGRWRATQFPPVLLPRPAAQTRRRSKVPTVSLILRLRLLKPLGISAVRDGGLVPTGESGHTSGMTADPGLSARLGDLAAARRPDDVGRRDPRALPPGAAPARPARRHAELRLPARRLGPADAHRQLRRPPPPTAPPRPPRRPAPGSAGSTACSARPTRRPASATGSTNPDCCCGCTAPRSTPTSMSLRRSGFRLTDAPGRPVHRRAPRRARLVGLDPTQSRRPGGHGRLLREDAPRTRRRPEARRWTTSCSARRPTRSSSRRAPCCGGAWRISRTPPCRPTPMSCTAGPPPHPPPSPGTCVPPAPCCAAFPPRLRWQLPPKHILWAMATARPRHPPGPVQSRAIGRHTGRAGEGGTNTDGGDHRRWGTAG